MVAGELNAEGNPAVDYCPILRGWGKSVEIIVDSCYGNRDIGSGLMPLGSYADLSILPIWCTGLRVILNLK